MKRFKTLLFLPISFLSAFIFAACGEEDCSDYTISRPTALVTVRPQTDGSFTLQLNDSTTLCPANMQRSPFGSKVVRALVNYQPEVKFGENSHSVRINWIDSIRTKMPEQTTGADDAARFGNDPIEIVKDWVTVAEDGFLTLRIRTRWGNGTAHYVHLVTGTNPTDPFTLELRHDARGDVAGPMGDALIAFNLNDLPRTATDSVKIKLSWTSFSGKKSAEFPLRLHAAEICTAETFPLNARVK